MYWFLDFTHRRVALTAALAAGMLFLTGCSSGPKRAGPVDAELARQCLRDTLDAWKSGDSAKSLRDGSPSITAQDFDWLQGFALVEFQIDPQDREDSCNLHCPVKLVLRDPKGNKVEKKVTYIIGTDPVITVFREVKM